MLFFNIFCTDQPSETIEAFTEPALLQELSQAPDISEISDTVFPDHKKDKVLAEVLMEEEEEQGAAQSLKKEKEKKITDDEKETSALSRGIPKTESLKSLTIPRRRRKRAIPVSPTDYGLTSEHLKQAEAELQKKIVAKLCNDRNLDPEALDGLQADEAQEILSQITPTPEDENLPEPSGIMFASLKQSQKFFRFIWFASRYTGYVSTLVGVATSSYMQFDGNNVQAVQVNLVANIVAAIGFVISAKAKDIIRENKIEMARLKRGEDII